MRFSRVAALIDKVVLLELGADNYITKLFSPRELLAWVRAALPRSAQPASREDIYRFGDLAVNFAKMKLTRADRPVPLTAHEFELLKFLAQNEERIF